MIRLSITLFAAMVLMSPTVLSAKDKDDSSQDTVCDGLSGAAKGLCNAYCIAQNCPANPSKPSCESLRRNFEKHTGSSTFPCDGTVPTSTSTATQAATRTATNTRTATQVPPTFTPTLTATVGTVEPSATETPLNTSTPTNTDTPTEVPPTATATFTVTVGTVEATATETPLNTNTPTGTPTEVPPTSTATFTVTVGTVEATATETPENTDTPTELPTPTFTVTVGTLEPTASETATPTFTPTATFTVGTAGETAEEQVGAGNLRGKFGTRLSGDAEVPPVDTRARGRATFRLNKTGDTLRFKVNVAQIDDVTQAHIHCGPAGVNGPVTVFLFGPVAGGASARGRLARGTITDADVIAVPDSAACPGGIASFDDLIDKIASGDVYVNVHTVAFPTGEIRGQL